MYIFGSQASGRNIAGSDVDIGVLFDRNDPDYIHSRMDEILLKLRRLLQKDIHPLAMNFASEVLLKQIFAKGRCFTGERFEEACRIQDDLRMPASPDSITTLKKCRRG